MAGASDKALQETRTFRPRPLRLVAEVAGVVLTLAVLVMCIEFLLPGRGLVIGLAVWLLLMCIYIPTDLPTWRTSIVVDRNGLSAKVRAGFYEVFWIEILAADLHEHVDTAGFPFHASTPEKYLWIATRKSVFNIPMQHLDAAQIWAEVQGRLAPEKVGDAAYKRWLEGQEWYQEWDESQTELVRTIDTPLRTRQRRSILAVYWLAVIFFVGSAVFSTWLTDGFSCLTLFSLGWAALAVPLVLPDALEMDDEKVTRISTFWGRHQIRWEEMERIEHDGAFSQLVFYGENKRLPVFGTRWWAAPKAEEMMALLRAQIHHHDIEWRLNPEAAFVFLPEQTEGEEEPQKQVLSRYYGRVEIDPKRANKDMGLIVEEVVERLTSQVGCDVEITVEINAKRPEGFDEGTVRTISENSRTLKFEDYGFEEG
jgi:hypothetical protein